MRASIAIAGVAAAILATAASASAARTAAILSAYNEDRVANGLPAVHTINPAMQQGCVNHDRYMFLNHELADGEDPSKPGYTPQGNFQDGAQGGQVVAEDIGWSRTYEPWRTAPIHLFLTFDPSVAQIGYADADGFQCLRMRGEDTPPPPPVIVTPGGMPLPPGPVAPPAFYAWTSDAGPKYVPPAEHAGETPYTPQQLVGIPASATTGPNILLFSAADRATPESATISGPQGQVSSALVNYNTSNSIGDGKWFPGGGVLIPRRPLRPSTTYTATVDWQDPAIVTNGGQYVQQFTFTTTHLPARLMLKLRADRSGHWWFTISGTPRPALILSGPHGRTLHPHVAHNRTRRLRLARGLWRACAWSATPKYPAADTCQQLEAR